jgi:hypothetical protein
MLVNGNYEVAQETAARLVPVSITCILSGTCISVLLKLTSSRVTCDTCSLKSRDAPGDRVPLNSVRRKIVDHFNGYLPRESDKPRICLLNALQNDALPWIMLKIDPHLLENYDRPYAVGSHTRPFPIYHSSLGDSLQALLQPIASLALKIGVGLAFSTLPLSGPSLLQVLSEPVQHQLTQTTISLNATVILRNLKAVHGAPLLDLAKSHVHEMRRPLRQVIEDVCRVHDSALARLGLLLQESQEVVARQQVQVDGDFVQQENGPGTKKTHAQLDSPPLAVADGVQVPAQVDVENFDQLVAALRVVVAADGLQQLRHGNVGADDWVQHPFQSKIGDAFEAGGERIAAADVDCAGRCHALTAQEAEQGCLASAIRSGDLAWV